MMMFFMVSEVVVDAAAVAAPADNLFRKSWSRSFCLS